MDDYNKTVEAAWTNIVTVEGVLENPPSAFQPERRKECETLLHQAASRLFGLEGVHDLIRRVNLASEQLPYAFPGWK